MNEFEEIADELAESFINGNIQYVRNEIKGSVPMALAVLKRLPYPEQESFIRLMQIDPMEA